VNANHPVIHLTAESTVPIEATAFIELCWNFASDFDASEAAVQRLKGHVRWVCSPSG
jgi:hypothetical protein